MNNIEFIKQATNTEVAQGIIEFRGNQINHLNQKTVKKALYKHCSPELANKVIHGYRRSSSQPQAIEADFMKSNVEYIDIPRDIHYQRAIKVVTKMFKPSRTLKPVSFPDLRYYPWHLSVSAEVPFTINDKYIKIVAEKQRDGECDGKLTFHNLYDEIFYLNRALIHQIKDKDPQFWKDGVPKPYYYHTLHGRAHLVESHEDDKIRAVFGVTKLFLFAEAMFIWPLMKELLNGKTDSPMLWGYETIKGGWRALHSLLTSRNLNTFISADWSGFDRTVRHEIITDIHNIIRSYFTFEEGYEPTLAEAQGDARLGYPQSSTNAERLENLFEWMSYNTKHTPIKSPLENIYKWKHSGLASGFLQTQILGSMINATMLLTSLSALGINIEAKNFTLKVQGDDSIIGFAEREATINKEQFLEKLASETKRRFGATMNTKKSEIQNTVEGLSVLSYRNKGGYAYREEDKLLALLLHPEKSATPEDLAASAIGIAYSSMGSSKTVYNVCKDVHDFLTNKMNVKPNFRSWEWTIQMNHEELPFTEEFPTFQQLVELNTVYQPRSETAKQRMWPTRPKGEFGFHFVDD
uniref:RNA-dependent RNA polymerase n=1 Tax=Sacamano partiti-like virus TaxID=2716662 RepID=A0A6G7PS59_9VIRU|nr:RNA-dependent RNA polymerase [Sacamano partiti-like virus]